MLFGQMKIRFLTNLSIEFPIGICTQTERNSLKQRWNQSEFMKFKKKNVIKMKESAILCCSSHTHPNCSFIQINCFDIEVVCTLLPSRISSFGNVLQSQLNTLAVAFDTVLTAHNNNT